MSDFKKEHLENLVLLYPTDATSLFELARIYEKEAYEHFKLAQDLIDSPKTASFAAFKETIDKSIYLYEKAFHLGLNKAQTNLARAKSFRKRTILSSHENHPEKESLRHLLYKLITLFTCIFALFFPVILDNSIKEVVNNWTYNYPTLKETNVIGQVDKTIANHLPLVTLRSALYHFVLQKGYYPDTLDELVQPFPENYLSSIPLEETSSSRQVYNKKTNEGGWVYSKPSNVSTEYLIKQIESSIYPNNSTCKTCEFTPLTLTILKDTHQAFLHSGETIIKEYEVGLGKHDLTPTGEFYIRKKVKNPNFHLPHSTKPFGTRGMELSNPTYAIHGTYESESIGENVSQGCIRLYNSDIEDLYDKIPLNTQVFIRDSLQSDKSKTDFLLNYSPSNKMSKIHNLKTTNYKEKSADSVTAPPVNEPCHACEEDRHTIYHWAN